MADTHAGSVTFTLTPSVYVCDVCVCVCVDGVGNTLEQVERLDCALIKVQRQAKEKEAVVEMQASAYLVHHHHLLAHLQQRLQVS